MKIISISCLILFLSHSFGQKSMTLGSDIWPPFTDLKGKKRIAIEIVSTALERMNQDASMDITEFHDVLKGLKDKSLDGCPALWKTPEREKTMIFSLPYLQNQLILIGRKGSDVNFSSMNEMKGKKLGLVKEYGYGDSIVNATNVDIVFNNNDQDNLEALLSGKIDLMLVDKILIQYMFKYQTNDVSEYLSIATSPFIVKSLFLALRNDFPNAKEIIATFDKQIDTMIADRTYNRILNMDWIQADMDGDGQKEYILNGKFAGNQRPDDNAYEVFLEKKKKSESNRYFINGSYYEGWDNVPSQYKKLPVSKPNYDPKNSSLNFKL